MHAHSLCEETVTKRVPDGERRLARLSDGELLRSTRRLVGTSNRLFAELLLHLAEVEARGIHRTRACSSLYTYCVHELRLSEDAAARRSSAARWVKRFPALFDAIARGELHLTGLLMLGPHLTPENHREVLARAQFRTKKELAKLVRELHPLPRVPDVMEPLGPELPRATSNPTWEQWVSSLCPPVRELKPGERPRDWANDAGVNDSSVNDAGVNDAGPELGETRQSEDPGDGETSEPFSTAPARREPPLDRARPRSRRSRRSRCSRRSRARHRPRRSAGGSRAASGRVGWGDTCPAPSNVKCSCATVALAATSTNEGALSRDPLPRASPSPALRSLRPARCGESELALRCAQCPSGGRRLRTRADRAPTRFDDPRIVRGSTAIQRPIGARARLTSPSRTLNLSSVSIDWRRTALRVRNRRQAVVVHQLG